MRDKKNIFAITGSARSNSANLKLVEYTSKITSEDFNLVIFNDLKNNATPLKSVISKTADFFKLINMCLIFPTATYMN